MLIDLDDLIEAAGRLDPLPTSVTRLFGLLGTPDWSLEEVERVVLLDQGLTLKVLQVANSAFSGSQRRIATVREAVVRLGGETLVSIAVAASAAGVLRKPLAAYGIAAGDLWRHSVAAALTVECLRSACGVKPGPEAFTAALLHDVGKLVMCQHLGESALQYLERARKDAGLPGAQAESEVLQVHHGELGGLIAAHWKLPDSIAVAIRHHHEPASPNAAEHAQTVCATSLGDSVAKLVGAGLAGETEPVADELEAAQIGLGIDAAGFARLCDQVAERLEGTLASYA